MSAHDPTARAEAAVPRWKSATPVAITRAGEGFLKHEPGVGTVWHPVEGPHLRAVCQRVARNSTGTPGISEGSVTDRRPRTPIVRHYYVVQLGPSTARFCIDTLGRREAWRRALRTRAGHELKVRRANAAILAAREKGVA